MLDVILYTLSDLLLGSLGSAVIKPFQYTDTCAALRSVQVFH
jgi:hypothetical protein